MEDLGKEFFEGTPLGPPRYVSSEVVGQMADRHSLQG